MRAAASRLVSAIPGGASVCRAVPLPSVLSVSAAGMHRSAVAGYIPDVKGDWDPWDVVDAKGGKAARSHVARTPDSIYKSLPKSARKAIQRDEHGRNVPTEEILAASRTRGVPEVEVEHANGRVEVAPAGDDIADFVEHISETNFARKRARAMMGPIRKPKAAGLTERSLLKAREPDVPVRSEHDAAAVGEAVDKWRDEFTEIKPEEIGDPTIGASLLYEEVRLVAKEPLLVSRLVAACCSKDVQGQGHAGQGWAVCGE
jgi:hypothetical protein